MIQRMKHLLPGSKTLSAIFAVTQLLTFMPGNVQAYSCNNTSILTNDGCEQGSFIFDTPANIESDAPFGIIDWTALDTSLDGIDDLVPGIALFTYEPSTRYTGFWAIVSDTVNPWGVYDDLMITFQGGAGSYVAYLLTPQKTKGVFFIADFAGQMRHARLWGTTAVIPVPASMLLFGSGLIGLVGVARRRSRQPR